MRGLVSARGRMRGPHKLGRRMQAAAYAILSIGASAPIAAFAQDHRQMGHSGMDHGVMDHSAMDHSAMDHSAMDRGAMPQEPAEPISAASALPTTIPQGPPPPQAFTGPTYAAEGYIDSKALAAARADMAREMGGMNFFSVMADRAELQTHGGKSGYLWDIRASYGGDINKLALRSEGEGLFGEALESAHIQGVWSRAISPWLDLELGARQDLAGPSRSYAVIGLQGLAPYMIEIDASAYVSTKGELTASFEAEFDQRITQRLILQPRLQFDLAAQNSADLGIGAGISSAETGLRLRYEIAREFAPYVGLTQQWKLGKTADYARAAGEDTHSFSLVIGVRFWF